MKRREVRQGQLDRLATRICAGEVVFFIGAGFSLDSEGNTAQLLVARLLARIEALTERTAISGDAESAELANRLRTGLRTTFSLEKSANGFSDLFDTTIPKDKSQSVLATTIGSLAHSTRSRAIPDSGIRWTKQGAGGSESAPHPRQSAVR